MNQIHPTAIVSTKAKLGDNITIGAYTIIENDVEIGDACNIGTHVVIYDGARIGDRVSIYQGASVANVPQDIKFGGEKSLFIIGEDTVVREFATLHRGTSDTGKSQVGKNCLLMAYSHIPHDCIVGDKCIIANGVQIAGHTEIGYWAIIGGLATVHQFVIIGDHVMIGGATKVRQDVPPFISVAHEPAKFAGLNVIGLRRRDFGNEDIEILKETYNYIYDNSLNVTQARKIIESKLDHNVHVQNVLNFLSRSKRGLVGK
jgi:UDP-N-acetylglucosamine acyltransferase